MRNRNPKTYCGTLLVLSISLCCSFSHSTAQTYSLGLAGVYGDDIDNLGVHVRGYINSRNHKFCIGPEFTWFFRETTSQDNQVLERDLFEINLNGHYVMELTETLGLYGLTGLNFSQEKEVYLHDGQIEEEEVFREYGINLGAGVHYIINANWMVFGEYDHLFSNLSQNTFTLVVCQGLNAGYCIY